jgi:hypothetical protein
MSASGTQSGLGNKKDRDVAASVLAVREAKRFRESGSQRKPSSRDNPDAPLLTSSQRDLVARARRDLVTANRMAEEAREAGNRDETERLLARVTEIGDALQALLDAAADARAEDTARVMTGRPRP